MSDKLKLSIIIPMYNEEESITESLNKVRDAFSEKFNLELVLVDDGSKDKTLEIIKALKSLTPLVQIKTVELSRNFGQSTAILAGLNFAEGDLVGIMDADLQDPPEIMNAMIKLLLKEDVDVVYGVRKRRHGESSLKRLLAWGFYRSLNLISQTPIPEDTGEFRVMKSMVTKALLQSNEHDPYVRGLVAWIGFKQMPYFFERPGRVAGETKYKLRQQLELATRAITSFSSAPLRLGVWVGIFGILFGVSLSLWSVYSWYMGGAVRGWSSLIAITALMNSIGFILTGINGMYVGRIYNETKNRPRYIVRNVKKTLF